ncbi:DUF3597 domain-containing protein [Piscinibacter sakaiensis]|uniref:DUF3597 domain-containing protein n=1 Tax=Piscinibacter sakaiensis TaxID=1547922 RepID=UPI003AB0A489
MSFFKSILGKLGIGDKEEEKQPTVAPSRVPEQSRSMDAPAPVAPPVAPPAAPVAPVDMVAKLDAMAAANPQKLNWRTSIVDLLKLLGLDSSLDKRKELAAELGCPPEKMGDSAAMNIWLHKAVMQKLAANGGNIPRELLD